MDDFKFNRMFDELKKVKWNESAFENLDWYYCEEALYAIRLDKGTVRERYLLVKAKSASAAVSIGVLNVYKE